MLVVTYSDARKTLAALLDRAKADGSVLIKRADGSLFRVAPETPNTSPLDLPPLDLRLGSGRLAAALTESIETDALTRSAR
ncbi:MAG: type II toxin-antitoxin system Phd/YefM family antitoxin [Spirochaetota bacterium]